jgi:hypothetical protein
MITNTAAMKKNTPEKNHSFLKREKLHQMMPELVLGIVYVLLFIMLTVVVYYLMA